MATNNAPADPLVTTEVSTSPLTPAPAGTVVSSPVSQPVGSPVGAPIPERVVDSGDPDIPGETREQATGVGTDGETSVWEARYSMKNFFGRLTIWGVATVAWIALAVYTWGYNHDNLTFLSVLAGIVLGLFWLGLARQIILCDSATTIGSRTGASSSRPACSAVAATRWNSFACKTFTPASPCSSAG